MSRIQRTFTAVLAMVMAMALLPAVASAQERVPPSWETAIDAINDLRQAEGLPRLTWWGDNSMADAERELRGKDYESEGMSFEFQQQVKDFYARSGAEVVAYGARITPSDMDPNHLVARLPSKQSTTLLPDATHIAVSFKKTPTPFAGECEWPSPDDPGWCEPDDHGVYAFHFITDLQGAGPLPPPFSDIVGTTHEDTILSVHAAEIASGFSDGTFRPGSPVTRGQMASFLARALDLPDSTATSSPFSDVAGTTHEAAIAAIVEANITTGFEDGTFRPGDNVTRGQMATFLTRGLDLDAAPAGASTFSDATGNTHEAAIRSIVAVDITTGFSDGTFRPGDNVTRGQMATFLARALGLE